MSSGRKINHGRFIWCILSLLYLTRGVDAHWMDTGPMVNDNWPDFQSDSIETKLSIAIFCILVPLYTSVSYLIYRRRNRFPFTGLHPFLLIANNAVAVVTLTIRLVIWMHWRQPGPPCGLEFIALQGTLFPYIIHILLRGWFLLFKNEVTNHLTHVSEHFEMEYQARLKEEEQQQQAAAEEEVGDGKADGTLEKNRSSLSAGTKSPISPTALSVHSPLYRLRAQQQQPGSTGSPKQQPRKSVPSAGVTMPEISTGSRARANSGARELDPASAAGVVGSPLAPVEESHGSGSESGGSGKTGSPRKPSIVAGPETPLAPQTHAWAPSTRMNITKPPPAAAAAELRIRVVEVAPEKEEQTLAVAPSPVAEGESTVLTVPSDVPDATAADDATDGVTPEDASVKGGKEDLSLLYQGFSGWFVRHRNFASNRFLFKIYLNGLIGNILVMVLLIFIDPDSAVVGGSWSDSQIGSYLWSAPPCTVMSMKQWLSRFMILLACPVIIWMWWRMKKRPADSFGLYHFMGFSGAWGQIAVVGYCLCLAYQPALAGPSTVAAQFVLFFVSDLKPLLRSYTSARERKKAFAAASIAMRLSSGSSTLTQKLKQFYRLKVVLRHQKAHMAFHDFTKKEFSSENVAFWSELRRYVRFVAVLEQFLPDWPRLGDDVPLPMIGDDAAGGEDRSGRGGGEDHSMTDGNGTNGTGGGGLEGSFLRMDREEDADEGSLVGLGRAPYAGRAGLMTVTQTTQTQTHSGTTTRRPGDIELEQALLSELTRVGGGMHEATKTKSSATGGHGGTTTHHHARYNSTAESLPRHSPSASQDLTAAAAAWTTAQPANGTGEPATEQRSSVSELAQPTATTITTSGSSATSAASSPTAQTGAPSTPSVIPTTTTTSDPTGLDGRRSRTSQRKADVGFTLGRRTPSPAGSPRAAASLKASPRATPSPRARRSPSPPRADSPRRQQDQPATATVGDRSPAALAPRSGISPAGLENGSPQGSPKGSPKVSPTGSPYIGPLASPSPKNGLGANHNNGSPHHRQTSSGGNGNMLAMMMLSGGKKNTFFGSSIQTALTTSASPAPIVPQYSSAKISQLRSQALQARSMALSIHRDFLAPGAPFEVNVPHDILSDVSRQIKLLEEWHPCGGSGSGSGSGPASGVASGASTPKGPPGSNGTSTPPSHGASKSPSLSLPLPPPVPLSSLFRAANVCILDLMQRDSFRRFVTSKAFATFLKEVEAEMLAEEERKLDEAAELKTTNPQEQLALLDSIEKEVAGQVGGQAAVTGNTPTPGGGGTNSPAFTTAASSPATPMLTSTASPAFNGLTLALKQSNLPLNGSTGNKATPPAAHSLRRSMLAPPPAFALSDHTPGLAVTVHVSREILAAELGQGLHTVNESRERESAALRESRPVSPAMSILAAAGGTGTNRSRAPSSHTQSGGGGASGGSSDHLDALPGSPSRRPNGRVPIPRSPLLVGHQPLL